MMNIHVQGLWGSLGSDWSFGYNRNENSLFIVSTMAEERFFSFGSELVFFFKWVFSLCVVGAGTRVSPCWMLGLDLRLGIWSSSTLAVAVGCFSSFYSLRFFTQMSQTQSHTPTHPRPPRRRHPSSLTEASANSHGKAGPQRHAD